MLIEYVLCVKHSDTVNKYEDIKNIAPLPMEVGGT